MLKRNNKGLKKNSDAIFFSEKKQEKKFLNKKVDQAKFNQFFF